MKLTNLLSNFFKIGNALSKNIYRLLSILGVILFLLIWEISPRIGLVNEKTVPPISTIMHSGVGLVTHVSPQGQTFWGAVSYSLKINIQGFVVAFVFAVFLGSIMGLYAPIDAVTSISVEPLRFIPLTGVVALFVGWFGIGDEMKVMFLGFSIFVYLLPVVRDTIKDIPKQLRQTGETLGATHWQMLKDVYIPYFMPIVFEQATILSAVAWTYIVIAETFNMSQVGLGTLMWIYPKKGDIATGLFVLFVLMVLAAAQTGIMRFIHKLMWPHKYDQNLKQQLKRWLIKE